MGQPANGLMVSPRGYPNPHPVYSSLFSTLSWRWGEGKAQPTFFCSGLEKLVFVQSGATLTPLSLPGLAGPRTLVTGVRGQFWREST